MRSKNNIPLINPDLPLYRTLEKDIRDIIHSKQLTKGKYLAKLEARIAKYLGVEYAVGVSSCTLGLMLVLKCLDLQGEIIIPSFTFIATAEAILWNNLKPVFVDINGETLNLDPEKIEAAITPKTSAILAVHVFGNPANIKALRAIAWKHKLKLIYDSAHAFGAKYKSKFIGGFGNAEVFSLSPTKLLITGEGGLITTNDKTLANNLVRARDYGGSGNGEYNLLGLNSRLGEFNAILGLQGLKRIKTAVVQRNKIAGVYKKYLSKIDGIKFQFSEKDNLCAYKDFAIIIDGKKFGLKRDKLIKRLTAGDIETRRYFDPPLHRQPIIRKYRFRENDLTVTEEISSAIICLPIWSSMDTETALKICRVIEAAHNHAK